MKNHSFPNLLKKIFAVAFAAAVVFMFTGCLVPNFNNNGNRSDNRGKNNSAGTIEIKFDTTLTSFHQTRIDDTYRFRISFPDWSPIPKKVDIWYEGLDQAWKKDVPVVDDNGSFYVSFTVTGIPPYKKYNIWAQIDDVKSNTLDEIRVLQKEQSITAELVSSYAKAVKFNLAFTNYDQPPAKLYYKIPDYSDEENIIEKEVTVVDNTITVDLSEAVKVDLPALYTFQCYEKTDPNDINMWVYSNTIENIVLKPKIFLYFDELLEDPYNAKGSNYPGKNQTLKIQFFDFETKPATVDVLRAEGSDWNTIYENVSVEDDTIAIPIKTEWADSNCTFKIKAGEELSNKALIKIKDFIDLQVPTTYIGDNLVINVDCGGLEEAPEKLAITIKQGDTTFKNQEEMTITDSKIIIPLSYADGYKSESITITANHNGKTYRAKNPKGGTSVSLNDKIGISKISIDSGIAEYAVYFYGDWETYPAKLRIYQEGENGAADNWKTNGTVVLSEDTEEDKNSVKGTMTFMTNILRNGLIFVETFDEKYRSESKYFTK